MSDDIERLEDKLGEVRKSRIEASPEGYERVERMAAELEQSIVIDAVDVGDKAPDFTLHQAGSDEVVQLSQVLERSAAVISFYRGHW